jgi:hypothetical protein
VAAPAAIARGTNEEGTGKDDIGGDSLWRHGDTRVADAAVLDVEGPPRWLSAAR